MERYLSLNFCWNGYESCDEWFGSTWALLFKILAYNESSYTEGCEGNRIISTIIIELLTLVPS